MLLRDIIKENEGFYYVVDNLDIISGLGKNRFMQYPMMNQPTAIVGELQRVEKCLEVISLEENRKVVNDIRHRLMEVHDIKGTLVNLSHKTLLDEVELFEMKSFAHIVEAIRKDSAAIGFDAIVELPSLEEVFSLLDPDGTRIPNFYIYDSYDNRLPEIRKRLKQLQISLSALSSSSQPEAGEMQNQVALLIARQNEVQNEVERRLTDLLFPFHDRVSEALEKVAYIDILMAKANLSREWNLCCPRIADSSLEMHGLFNPRLKHHNEKVGLRYQPVDVSISEGLTLITGANMAGKTVVLKTLSIAQLMMQWGMFVPAEDARMMVVDDVVLCVGDDQNEMNGLSSFASEITKISSTLARTAREKLLVLIDEPARTTNPVEGKAIVQAISQILSRRDSIAVITTHYSQLGIDCKRLRVRGFRNDLVDGTLLPENINKFMDYALIEEQSDEVPQEALRIARILGCDEEMVSLAESFCGLK